MIWSALSNTMRRIPPMLNQPQPQPVDAARTPAVNPNAPIPNMPRDARRPQPEPTVAPTSLPNKVTPPTNQPLPIGNPRFPVAPTSPMTPGFNPEAATPPIPTRQQPEQEYGVKRDWKNVLRNTALGGFQGMARTGTWQGGLAGAATAGGISAISPQIGMEYWKTQAEQPREDAQLAREAVINGRAQEQAYNQARIDNLGSQSEARRTDEERKRLLAEKQAALAEAQRRRALALNVNGRVLNLETGETIADVPNPNADEVISVPGLGVVKKHGGEVVKEVLRPEKPARQMSLDEAMAEEADAEGSVDQIAADTMAGRQEAIMGQLTRRERELLAGNAQPLIKRTANGEDVEQSETELNAEMQAAQSRFQHLRDQEERKVRAEVERTRRTNAARRRSGGRSGGGTTGRANSSTAPRNLTDLMDLFNR